MVSFPIYSWLRFLSAGIDYKREGAPMPDLKYNLSFWFGLTRGQVCVWLLSWRGVSHVRQEGRQQLWPMLDTDCAADLTHLMPLPFTGETGCGIRQFAVCSRVDQGHLAVASLPQGHLSQRSLVFGFSEGLQPSEAGGHEPDDGQANLESPGLWLLPYP